MRRRPLNISAALAIAIERQVEDIIAIAKAQCALQYREAARRGLADPSMPGPRFAAQANFEDPEADRPQELGDAPRPWSDFPGSDDPLPEPTLVSYLNIWMRLRSLLTPRPFRC
jgi:hypothetical protein